ncbi:MAG: DNA polymerase III subunit gamma/tau [Planctomycetota bacterium]
MSYTVLARRYRSTSFDELVGQEPIARTLRNAIASNRTAHAYLFCGTRGVGKTSMARIFARALNVSDDLAEADAIAEAILRGDDLDVIEIDGASNRGINEARDLIASAGLAPARCRYRIYIIDEVHMLTREAFNALLKTMEEPPSHVKFILCTTEPVKVPATIQSRCQRFDFRPIPARHIAAHLHAVLSDEQVEAEEALVQQVARLGRGSMRDALSLLDRLIATGQHPLTVAGLDEMLGLPDHALVAGVVDAVAAGDAVAALEGGGRLLDTGISVETALELLAEHLRTLMLVAAGAGAAEMLELTDDAVEAASAQARHFDAPALVHMIAVCDAVARNARHSAIGRALYDAALVRLATAEREADIRRLLAGDVPPPAAATGSPGAKKKDDAPAPPVRRPAPPAPRAPDATPGPRLTEVKPAPVPVPAPAPPAAGASAPTDAAGVWSAVLASAGTPAEQARLDHIAPRSFDGKRLVLALEAEGANAARWLSTQTGWIETLVHRATGHRVTVELDLPGAAPPARAAAAGAELEEVRRRPEIRAAMELFDATVTDVSAARGDEGRAGGAEETDDA